MKKRIALACMIAALVTPAFAACGDKTSDETQTVLPPEEIVVPVAPPQNDPVEEEPEVTPPEEEQPNDPDDTAPAMAKYIITTTDNLNVRSGAGTNFSSLGTVEKNILMKHVDKTGTWYETRYLGRKAYIHANYAKIVVLEQGDEKTERIIEEGLNVLGTPMFTARRDCTTEKETLSADLPRKNSTVPLLCNLCFIGARGFF